MQCTVLKDEPGLTLVMNGDVPCLKAETLERLYQEAQDHSLVLLSAILEDGAHYGRVVRDENGAVKAIVEAKDCTESQKQIREINAGVYCFNNRDLFDSLDQLTTNNAQHEYYLTDLVKILADKGKSVQAIAADPDEMAGINTVSELADVYTWMKDNINRHWLENGVQIVDPKRTVIGKDVKFGHDVIVWPDTHILGNTTIGEYVEILPQTWVNNSQIGDHSKLQASILEDASLPEHSTVINQVINGFKEG